MWLQIKAYFEFAKKQATGVLKLVDTATFKADAISYESYYHRGSTKTTFIIEIVINVMSIS